MNTQINLIATKFVKWEVPSLETLRNSKAYLLREKLNNGGKMNREEKDWLANNLLHNSYFQSSVPLMGYRFNFSDIVKSFLVNEYGSWHEYKAPDKTSLRNTLCGKINKIVELN